MQKQEKSKNHNEVEISLNSCIIGWLVAKTDQIYSLK